MHIVLPIFLGLALMLVPLGIGIFAYEKIPLGKKFVEGIRDEWFDDYPYGYRINSKPILLLCEFFTGVTIIFSLFVAAAILWVVGNIYLKISSRIV